MKRGCGWLSLSCRGLVWALGKGLGMVLWLRLEVE